MSDNESVKRYRRVIELNIPPAVKAAAMNSLVRQGELLMTAMRGAVPVEHGALRNSIRMEVDDSIFRITVMAGGKATTRPVRAGTTVTFDYALAQEYGTERMKENPFFWPMYRLLKKSRRRAVKAAMTRAIKKEYHD
jgi:HK97 gp10 family phage protein